MKRLLLLAICAAFLSGCVSMTYKTADGTVLKYKRFWKQEIDGLLIEKDGMKVQLQKQKADQDKLIEAIESIGG